MHLRIQQPGDRKRLPRKGTNTGGRQLRRLEQIDDIRTVDAQELRTVKQQRFVLLQGTEDFAHRSVRQVEIEVFAIDLHIGELGKGDPDQ